MTSNDDDGRRRRTTDDGRRTTNDERQTMNDERRATSDERRTTNDEGRTTTTTNDDLDELGLEEAPARAAVSGLARVDGPLGALGAALRREAALRRAPAALVRPPVIAVARRDPVADRVPRKARTDE